MGIADPSNTARSGELTVSGRHIAGRDELPPAPPSNVRAELDGEMVEISWNLSPDEGEVQWIPYGGRLSRRFPVTGYRVYQSKDGAIYEEVGWVPEGMDRFATMVGGEPAMYRYKVAAEENDNLGEEIIIPGSQEDEMRTVVMGGAVGRDEEGNAVVGLFDEDLTVGFSDFFSLPNSLGGGRKSRHLIRNSTWTGMGWLVLGIFLFLRKILARWRCRVE